MEINELYLRTAFACMSSDGDIAKEEVALIEKMNNEDHLFGDINLTQRLEVLLTEINEQGLGFMKKFIDELSKQNLSIEEELQLLTIAAKTIYADNKVEYSEVKFFKLIRSCLKKVDNQTILNSIEEIDENWVEEDIVCDNDLLYVSYSKNVEMKLFDLSVINN
ncbi:MAG: TerB family tellurite resistance protein [Salinivirgaceae bacterium]|nr:TerB family tellurite resistance protein [Salinivirgaceae bacterium]